MDLAVDGQGFFQVLLPDGRMGYTRNGAFSRDAEGTLTTASGYVVQPEIQIPEGATEINVGANGVVSVLVGGQADPQEVGQLTLVDFINPRGLQPIGESFAVETPASGGPIEGNPFEGGSAMTRWNQVSGYALSSSSFSNVGSSPLNQYYALDSGANQAKATAGASAKQPPRDFLPYRLTTPAPSVGGDQDYRRLWLRAVRPPVALRPASLRG